MINFDVFSGSCVEAPRRKISKGVSKTNCKGTLQHPARVMGVTVTSPVCATSVPSAVELTNKLNMASLQCDADGVHLEELMVQDLVDMGVTQIPTKFVRPVHERSVPEAHRADYFRDQPEVPVIDMAPLLLELAAGELDHPQAVKEKRLALKADIARACEEWGFFQVPLAYYCQKAQNYVH